MTPEEMQRCVDDIVALGNRVRAHNELDERAQVRPPADPTALAAFADEIEAGKVARGERYVFARSDWDSLAIALLRNERGADGEPAVVMLDARGVVERHASLPDYLRSRRAWFAAQADAIGPRDAL